jgi:hypothetical protein
MAFVNEYIPEADYEKYDLRRVCGERNFKYLKGEMHSRDWTIDRDKDVFLIKTWSHHESEFDGWAFYWRGNWMFFEVKIADGSAMPDGSSCWFLFQLKGFTISQNLDGYRLDILNDLEKAFTAMPGGMTFNYSKRSATIEFIKE